MIPEATTLTEALEHLTATLTSTLLDLQTQVQGLALRFYMPPAEPENAIARHDDEPKDREIVYALTSKVTELVAHFQHTWGLMAERYGQTAAEVLEKVEETKVMLEQTFGEGKLQLQLHYNAAINARQPQA
ncbi:hypothetical protein ACHHYP_13811 [Achlya hypogyna]|uniref:Uncharacterized protein n=1 Tax=Achlya hypogyna TaxID=1202772 RepID=A0A1V9ZFG3_ACHHY|nr:hypothetical protein ACHHYP_13811 [Achlya hypogyna]